MKVTFEKDIQGLPCCVVSVSVQFSEAALEKIDEVSESAHGAEGQSFLLGALLVEIAGLLDRADLAVLNNLDAAYRASLSNSSVDA